MAQVVTAQRLLDGRPVYLDASGAWRLQIAMAHVYDDEDESIQHVFDQARQREAEVCDPYLLPVGVEGGVPVPLSARERIRAAGPRSVLERYGYWVDGEAPPVRAVG